jgi:hypothetical protein
LLGRRLDPLNAVYPPEIAHLLDSNERFRDATLVLGVPEHQVGLKGGGHASQTDFWALLSTRAGLVSTAVEAKAGEPFDETVEEWLKKAKPGSGKPARLDELCRLWRTSAQDVGSCRYQLMHRPATAIFEAKRFHATAALFLVHAFERKANINKKSLEDYKSWRRALKIDDSQTGLQNAGVYDGIELWIAWITAPTASERLLRDAV